MRTALVGVLVTAAVAAAPAGSAPLKPGWSGESVPRTPPHFDIAIQGVDNGKFPWFADFSAPCAEPAEGADAGEVGTPFTHEAPIRISHGRFTASRHNHLGTQEEYWLTVSAHRVGRNRMVGTARVHSLFRSGSTITRCDTGVLHFTLHRDTFAMPHGR
jgi:hypothetical protein